MVLTGADIKQYIAYGGLRFEPELQEDQFQQNGVDLILGSARFEGSVLIPDAPQFWLGTTREYITMPNDLMALVGVRSTWARLGIGMLGLTVIDAGFPGQITLEIISMLGNKLPVGERFVHLIFEKLCTPSAPYAGKYQYQRGITEAKLDK